ncbi:MAG: hypothetical protein CMA10_04525 [Euryarchaeota archaeon]|nr:hypothetical protein [Euryarchaeota archaeon]|tara:strand:+ start:729 stop:1247 length:519 start_codon:yes stop_codon:yes gene_type:complete
MKRNLKEHKSAIVTVTLIVVLILVMHFAGLFGGLFGTPGGTSLIEGPGGENPTPKAEEPAGNNMSPSVENVVLDEKRVETEPSNQDSSGAKPFFNQGGGFSLEEPTLTPRPALATTPGQRVSQDVRDLMKKPTPVPCGKLPAARGSEVKHSGFIPCPMDTSAKSFADWQLAF